MPDAGTHYRADEDAPVPAGVYRLVGLEEGEAALLRVADAEGNRAHTGVVEHVDADGLAALEPTGAPAESRLRAVGSGLLLGLRQAPRNALARPIQSALGAILLAVAVVGPSVLGAPDAAFAAANLLGAVLLGAAAAGIPRPRPRSR
ncbi:MAG: hypothetical protein ABEI11_01710 [Haloarculaceae archaeon]